MKKIVLIIISLLTLLIVSCDQVKPVFVTITNESTTPIFWNLRRFDELESNTYLKLEKSAKMNFILDSKTDFILSYASLATDNTNITSNILVINQTSGDIKQLRFNTILTNEKIIFKGTESNIDCVINFKPGMGF